MLVYFNISNYSCNSALFILNNCLLSSNFSLDQAVWKAALNHDFIPIYSSWLSSVGIIKRLLPSCRRNAFLCLAISSTISSHFQLLHHFPHLLFYTSLLVFHLLPCSQYYYYHSWLMVSMACRRSRGIAYAWVYCCKEFFLVSEIDELNRRHDVFISITYVANLRLI